MGIGKLTLLAVSGIQLLGAWAAVVDKRQAATGKFCPGGTNICFSEALINDLTFRIAIPDVKTGPFDILLQIVAPKATTGWAALAWGGKMANNPLTVAWANGGGVVVSSRWTNGHTLPGVYTGTTYHVLPSTHINDTHWSLDVLCIGCSQFGSTSLNPSGANTLAWAKSSKAVQNPASNSSTFSYHESRGTFNHDFTAAKIPQGVFDALVYDLENNGGGGNSAPQPNGPSSGASPPEVATSVVTLAPISSRSTVLSQPTNVGGDATPQPQNPVTSTSPPVKTSPPIVFTSVVTLPPHSSAPPVDSPITVTVTRQQPPPQPTVTTVTVWVTRPSEGPTVTLTQPPGGGITITTTLPQGGGVTVGPFGPWGDGPPPWASPGATPPWGYSGPPPWIAKGKGKWGPGRPIATPPPAE